MSKKIILKKATRIEGDAHIDVRIEDNRVMAARFVVHDFRGFERFLRGRRVEHVPHLVSRICGLCSSAQQVASLKAIERALAIPSPPSVNHLREVIVLGEWISSHALSYFFLSMPDFLGTGGGVFELMESHPEITREALALRKSGQEIVRVLGERAVHPVTLGVGRFLRAPGAAHLDAVQRLATDVKERTARLIQELGKIPLSEECIDFPSDQQVNFLVYDGRPGQDIFRVYNRRREVTTEFGSETFEENISEMRADWTYSKFPYLTHVGFPEGIMLVGPLSRSLCTGGLLSDRELAAFPLTDQLREPAAFTLESYDTCRLLEIFWAARRILALLEEIDLKDLTADVDTDRSGKGIGVVEAPRGVLIHSYLVKRGCIERMRLLVATQFNNAFINRLLRDVAEKNVQGDTLSPEGDRLIGRCIRIFDPCLSCATH